MTNRINFFHAYWIPVAFFAVVGIASSAVYYGGQPYEIDQITVHLSNAQLTNNIEAKIGFFKDAQASLQNYHGNSGFLYPNDETNIDVTKQLINDSLIETIHQIPTDNKTQWMVLPHNDLNDYLNKQVSDASDRLHSYARALNDNPTTHFTWWLTFIAAISSIIIVAIVDNAVNRNRSGW